MLTVWRIAVSLFDLHSLCRKASSLQINWHWLFICMFCIWSILLLPNYKVKKPWMWWYISSVFLCSTSALLYLYTIFWLLFFVLAATRACQMMMQKTKVSGNVSVWFSRFHVCTTSLTETSPHGKPVSCLKGCAAPVTSLQLKWSTTVETKQTVTSRYCARLFVGSMLN
jgi:hypothetical protein